MVLCAKDPSSQIFGLLRWGRSEYRQDTSWTLTAELQRRKQAMEMRCYRKILRISYKERVTNEEVRAKIQQAIGLHKDRVTNEEVRAKIQLQSDHMKTS